LLVFGFLVACPAGVLLRCWRVGGGMKGLSVSTYQIIELTIVTACSLILLAVFLWRHAGRQQAEVISPPAPPPPPLDPNGLDSLLQSMSARVAALEGRLGAVAAELTQVALLQTRLAAVEASMPSMQEAYEKYGDQVARADKRATERHRVEEKTAASFQTAGDAAELIAGAGAGGNPAPTQLAPAQNNRAGVVGSGGRSRFGKGGQTE